MLAQAFVHGLAVGASLGQGHEQALDGGKGAVGGQVALYGGFVHAQAVEDAPGGAQQLIADQEGLGQQAAAVGRIIQGALEQGVGGVIPGQAGHLGQGAGERIDLLGSFWVALEGHGRGANLLLAKRLAQLAEGRGLQQAQVESKFIQRAAQPGQGAEQLVILLAGVNLGGNREEGQVEQLREALLEGGQLLNAEQLGVRGAGAHRTLKALAAQPAAQGLEGLVIHLQVLGVGGQAVAQGRRLGGLQVGEGHQRQVGVGFDLEGEGFEQAMQAVQEQVEGLAHAQHVGVVFDIHRSGAQVQDAAAQRSLLGEGFQLRHQVVVDLGLDLQGAGHIHFVHVLAQVGDLFGAQQAIAGLHLGQGDP